MGVRSEEKRSPRRARPGAALAAFVVIMSVAAQIGAATVGADSRFWPFLRYSMYATAAHETFTHEELCVVVAAGRAPVHSWGLGITTFRYYGLLRLAADDTESSQRVRGRLGRLVATYVDPSARLELRQATYRMGPGGLADPSPEWRLVASWEAGEPFEGRPELPDLRRRALPVGSGLCTAVVG